MSPHCGQWGTQLDPLAASASSEEFKVEARGLLRGEGSEHTQEVGAGRQDSELAKEEREREKPTPTR